MDSKFGEILNYESMSDLNNDRGRKVLNELKLFGIHSLREFDNIVPKDFLLKSNQLNQIGTTNYLGMIRDFMIIYDINKYFDSVWEKDWTHYEQPGCRLLDAYNVEYKSVFKKYKITIYTPPSEWKE